MSGPPPDLSTLRAALWAYTASIRVRRQLSRRRLEDVRVPPPPRLPPEAVRGLGAVLRRRRDSCLVQAAVRQAWHAAHGDARDLVIGVTAPGAGFRAHAWLAGDHEDTSAEFSELVRRPATA